MAMTKNDKVLLYSGGFLGIFGFIMSTIALAFTDDLNGIVYGGIMMILGFFLLFGLIMLKTVDLIKKNTASGV
jgi:uncharacterized membrane protein